MLRLFFRKPSLAALALLLIAGTAHAEGVLERVARTGVLNAGTRADAMPFAYRLEDGRLDGLSIDLLRAIRDTVARQTGRPVELRLHAVTPSDRIEKVQTAAIDIECGITTPTWDREEQIDFSIPFFENGTRVLALRTTARDLNDLQGRRVGVVRGSTTARIVQDGVAHVTLVEVPNMEQGLAMLERGEIEGLSNLGIVLRAQVENAALKSKVLLLPRTGALSYESIACILPKNDSAWRDTVNRTLAELLDGLGEYRGAFMRIHDRWLGPGGPIYYPLDRTVAERLAASVVWLK